MNKTIVMMRTYLQTHRRTTLIVASCVVVAIIIIGSVMRREPGVVTTSTLSSSPSAAVGAATSSNTTSSANAAPTTASISTPSVAITHPTCTLNLRFGATSGDPVGIGTVHYTLAASNIGRTACTSASISVYYNDGETFVSSVPAPTSDGYYWKLGTLTSGQQTVITLATDRAQTLAPGNDTTQACLSADNGSDACANASAGGAVAGTTGGATVTTGENASVGESSEPPPNVPTPTLTAFPQHSGREIGIWQWTSLVGMSPSTMQTIIDEAAANHFTVIYQTIDAYLGIDALPDGTAKTQQLAAFNTQVSQFLSLAAAKGIAVDAEAGWRDWAEAGNTWESSDIMDFVTVYNAAHAGAAKFQGIQYDIEPYLLPQYGTDQVGILTDYITLTQNLAAKAKQDGIPLTMIIPDFYDGSPAKTPEVSIGNATDYPYAFILQALATSPNSHIIVMAYNNTANGAGGSISLAENEIHLADATDVKVIVAQETGPVSPAYVTFNGQSRSTLFTQSGGIFTAFANNKSFGGIAVDYLDPFLQLQ